MANLLRKITGILSRTLQARPSQQTSPARETRPSPRRSPERGRLLEYAPDLDGDADPGEIVWTWVAYEEDPSQGKDRPVLVVGRDGGALLALMMSSKDHDLDAADEARHGRHWVDVGSGPWDRQGRPSEVRVDRVLEVDEDGIRREGAVLDRSRFDRVAAALRSGHGWR